MAEYPLLFGYRDLVAGDGFLAGVAVDGRALLVDDDEGAWVYGVNPGGVSASGHDHGSATAAFRAAYRSVLFDIATDCASFADFKSEVESFFWETSLPTEQAWTQAVAAVKAGKVDLEWMIKKPAESGCCVEVVEIDAPRAAVNELDKEAIAA